MTDKIAIPGQTAKLNDFLCFAVYSASHAFGRLYQPRLDAAGLTYTQFLAMVALWEQDDQTVGSLGEKLFLESNTLTPLLKRLETMGHISRARDASDERQVRIRLTDAGRALRGHATEVPADVSAASGMSEDELAKLTEQLIKLRNSFAQYIRARGEQSGT
jgi:DNA-binding MarR family transcriptional regulator